MIDPVMSTPRLRRVLNCVNERWQTAKQIAAECDRRYPPDIELFLRISNNLRNRWFPDKPPPRRVPSIQKELTELVNLGYIRELEGSERPALIPKRVHLFQLTDIGRSALHAAKKK